MTRLRFLLPVLTCLGLALSPAARGDDSPGVTPEKPKGATLEPKAVAKALKKLLAAAPSGSAECIRVGLWFAGPLTNDDLAELEQIGAAMQKSKAHLDSVLMTGLPDAQMKVMSEALTGVHICADFRTMAKLKDLDVTLLFGVLRSGSVPDEFTSALGKDARLSGLVEQAAVWSCQASRDVYVETSTRDAQGWTPGNQPDGALVTAEKKRRVVWLGGALEEFFGCVRSRKVGAGDIRAGK